MIESFEDIQIAVDRLRADTGVVLTTCLIGAEVARRLGLDLEPGEWIVVNGITLKLATPALEDAPIDNLR